MGLVRFAERRNLISARAPSHFKRSLLSFATTSDLPLTTLTIHSLLILLQHVTFCLVCTKITDCTDEFTVTCCDVQQVTVLTATTLNTDL